MRLQAIFSVSRTSRSGLVQQPVQIAVALCLRDLTLFSLEPAQPVVRPPAMRGDNKNLNDAARLTIENVVRKARYSITPNTWGKLNTIPLWVFTDLDHCRLESSKISHAESRSTLFVVGDVLKMFNPRRLTEEVAHLSKAWA